MATNVRPTGAFRSTYGCRVAQNHLIKACLPSCRPFIPVHQPRRSESQVCSGFGREDAPDSPLERQFSDVVYTAEQLAFLERKRRYQAGTGPALPEQSNCLNCEGIGTVACTQCDGTGTNSQDAQGIMNADEGASIFTRNGKIDVRWMMQKGGPCWLCRGARTLACKECSGTGIKGGTEKFNVD